MIKSFRHKGLERLFFKDDKSGVIPNQAARMARMLDRLDAARRASDMNLPGFGFHELKSKRSGSFAVSVSGNWRIIFQFQEGHAWHVDLEDYH